MPTSPRAEWTATLDRMTAEIARSLADLDQYELRWASHPDAALSAVAPDQLFAWLERRLGAWDSKLGAAAELAASVESQLGERESALMRWHTMFVRWRDLIQQREPVDPTTGSRLSG